MRVLLPLKFSRLWIGFGWVLVASVILSSIFPGHLFTAINVAGADKVAHAMAYCVLMIWFSGLYARRYHAVVALALTVLGAVLELIQWRLPYRLFDPADLLANAAGVVIGLGLSVWLLAGWCQRIESRLGYHD